MTALAADETSQYYSTNLPPALLLAGPNVLAVEIHQNGTNSSDLSFALELRATEHDPALLVQRSGTNQCSLSWPFPSTGFVLQSAPSLQSPSAWSNVTQPVSVLNARNEVTLPFTAPARFFRLRRP